MSKRYTALLYKIDYKDEVYLDDALLMDMDKEPQIGDIHEWHVGYGRFEAYKITEINGTKLSMFITEQLH